METGGQSHARHTNTAVKSEDTRSKHYDKVPQQEWESSSGAESSSHTTAATTTPNTLTTLSPASSTRQFSAAGVIRSLFHAVLVQDTEHLDHVLKTLMLDPNKIRDKERKTMLMVAATENKHHVVRYLLTLPSIKVDLQDDEGETALYQAAAAGSTECVQLLLLAGASAQQGNEEAITPLIIASYNGFASICRLLLTLSHADVNQRDNTQKSALLLASYAGHVVIMIELIEHGAELDALDQYGWSSLMLAAYAGKLDACKLLLEQGADPHIKTSNGKNARNLAWDAGHKSIASYISKFVAKGALSNSLKLGRPILQPLPPVPRSPSRRTHSPAPSLPSVPEEIPEDEPYRARYSFSGHTGSISHSARSSRFTSPPTTLRRLPAAASAPVAPFARSDTTSEPSEQLIVENSPTSCLDSTPTNVGTATHLATMFDTPTPESIRPIESTAWAGTSSQTQLASSVAQHFTAPRVHTIEGRDSTASHVQESHTSSGVTTTVRLHRKGIVPRYGDKQLTLCPVTTISTSTVPATQCSSCHFCQQSRSTTHERNRKQQMEHHLNKQMHRQSTLRNDRPWGILTTVLTLCCPAALFPATWSRNRINDWRSKMTLCLLLVLLAALFGILAFGISLLVCRAPFVQPMSSFDFYLRFGNTSTDSNMERLGILRGEVYDLSGMFERGLLPHMSNNKSLDELSGTDISFLFPPSTNNERDCFLYGAFTSFGRCPTSSTMDECNDGQFHEDALLSVRREEYTIHYSWDDIYSSSNLLALDGNVLDVTDYLNQPVDKPITSMEQYIMNWIRSQVGRDATMAIAKRIDRKHLLQCLIAHFKVGNVSGQANSCVVSIAVDALALVLLVLVVLMRLASALVYRWLFTRGTKVLLGKSSSQDLPCAPTPVLMFVRCRESDTEQDIRATLDSLEAPDLNGHSLLLVVVEPSNDLAPFQGNRAAEICLGLLSSNNPAQNMVTVDRASSDHLLRLSHEEPLDDNRPPVHFDTSSSRTFSGFYTVQSTVVPCIVALLPRPAAQGECGDHATMPTAKGWVVQFLFRSFFRQSLTQFEYGLLEAMQQLTGHGPEAFHLLLTTEMGTIAKRGSIEDMVRTLEDNRKIMALCGQRVVRDRTRSWLTRVQDCHIFLENQFVKPFESTLGSVMGLPEEFSMIRIKMEREMLEDQRENGSRARGQKRHSDDTSILTESDGEVDCKDAHEKDGAMNDDGEKEKVSSVTSRDLDESHKWTPILVHPSVAGPFTDHNYQGFRPGRRQEYDQGEDWLLAGLLQRTFPTRSIAYLPHAICNIRASANFKEYLNRKQVEWHNRVYSAWMLATSSNQPHGRGIVWFWLYALEFLALVLMPAMILFQWILVVLVVVGTLKGNLSTALLNSYSVILMLAFTTVTLMYQLVLGTFLMQPGTMNIAGFILVAMTLPLWQLVQSTSNQVQTLRAQQEESETRATRIGAL
ncbi:hypothetical protein BGZ94_008395 [Podila epigama]|nr:hypothetical protein BGZ94_008395 [Podila epigama]